MLYLITCIIYILTKVLLIMIGVLYDCQFHHVNSNAMPVKCTLSKRNYKETKSKEKAKEYTIRSTEEIDCSMRDGDGDICSYKGRIKAWLLLVMTCMYCINFEDFLCNKSNMNTLINGWKKWWLSAEKDDKESNFQFGWKFVCNSFEENNSVIHFMCHDNDLFTKKWITMELLWP